MLNLSHSNREAREHTLQGKPEAFARILPPAAGQGALSWEVSYDTGGTC